MTIALIILGIILIILGLAGTIFPALPGLPFMFTGLLSLAWAHDFHYIGTWTLIAAAIITIIGVATDFVAGILGAKMTGASKKALWGAFIGGIIFIPLGILGLPAGGILGIIFGPLIGAAIGEYMEEKDSYKAGKVSLGTFAGFIIGTVAKIGCALAILLLIPVAYLF